MNTKKIHIYQMKLLKLKYSTQERDDSMINYQKQYEKVNSTFIEVQQSYKEFKKNVSYENRNKLKNTILKHRKSLTDLNTSVKNIFLK